MILSVNDFINELSIYADKDIIVYGAGLVGKTIIKFLLNHFNDRTIFIAVTNSKGNSSFLMGQRIYSIADLKDKKQTACVIIATMENKHSEMLKILKLYEFRNIIQINDQLYSKLRGNEPDYSIDIVHELENLKKQISELHKKYHNNNYVGADYDRKLHHKLFFYYLNDDKNFKQKYLDLVRNLDIESIETVNLIIKRMQVILNPSFHTFEIFTKKETDILQKKNDEFISQILKVSDDLYCYKNYRLPQNNFSPEVFYYKLGLDLLNTKSVKNKDIIDVGAYIGDSALLLSPLTKRKVYAFEAVKDTYEILLKTLELNELKNVVPVNIALGSENKLTTINIRQDSNAGNGIMKREGVEYIKEEQVSQKTLDDYVTENNLNVGLIKVDIEGAEQDFLSGAIKTIKRYKPILILSIYHSADDFFLIKPKLEALKIGYTFKIFKPVLERSIISETLLLAEVQE